VFAYVFDRELDNFHKPHIQYRQLAANFDILREVGILLPNNQHQHRTMHIQKDMLPYALC